MCFKSRYAHINISKSQKRKRQTINRNILSENRRNRQYALGGTFLFFSQLVQNNQRFAERHVQLSRQNAWAYIRFFLQRCLSRVRLMRRVHHAGVNCFDKNQPELFLRVLIKIHQASAPVCMHRLVIQFTAKARLHKANGGTSMPVFFRS